MSIVNFALDTTALEAKDPDAEVIGRHRRLLRAWRNHGCLVHDDGALRRMKAHLESLPADLRREWVQMIKHSFTKRSQLPSSDLTQADQIEHLTTCEYDVACLEEARSLVLGLAHDQLCRNLGNIELTRYQHLDETEAYQSAVDWSQSPIPQGTPRQELWRKRLEPLAIATNEVAIVDRYAINSACKPQRQQNCGIRNLLLHLDASPSKASNVTLISEESVDPPHSIDATIKWIGDLVSGLSRGGVRKVTLYTCSGDLFKETAHDRQIRFGSHVVEIGIGLEVLQGTRTRRNTNWSIKPKHKLHLEVESTLKAKATRVIRFGPTRVQ